MRRSCRLRLTAVTTCAPRAPGRDQFGDHLGRVLEIAVHEHNGVAARSLHARRERPHVSPVARKVHDYNVRILDLQFPQQFQRGIPRTIVHIDDFPAFVDLLHGTADRGVKQAHDFLFVVNRMTTEIIKGSRVY